MHYSYKFRLYPNDNQKVFLSKHFGCCRFVYNYYLNKSIQDYQQNKDKKRNKYEYIKDIVKLKKEYERLKEVNSQSLQSVLDNLDKSYNKFFNYWWWFPNFKKKNSKQSFKIPQHYNIENKIYIPKLKEWIVYKEDRKLEWKTKAITISQTSDWKYYISILVEKEIKQLLKTWKQVWCDLWLKDLLITSDWKKYKTIKQDDIKIKRLQMRLSKKEKWSRRYKQLKNKIAKLHQHNSNRRTNRNHNISINLVRDYDLIAFENLNVKWMMKNHCLAKSIWNQWRSDLVEKVKYKSEMYWKTFYQIDRFFPSSKQCNKCWNVKRKLWLNERQYICDECWNIDDRDINAAKNILQYAKLELKL